MRSTLLIAAFAMAASAAAAQQATPPAQTQTRPAWMGPGLVEYLATSPADLNLTRDQQSRIRQAREQLDRANTPLHERLRTLRATMMWGSLTTDQRRAMADTGRQIHEQALANMLTALDAANATLTQEQRNTLEARRASMRGPMMGRGMMMRRGMMGPGTMERGMMRPGGRGGMRGGPGMGGMPGMGAGMGMDSMSAPGAPMGPMGPPAPRFRRPE